MTATTAESLLDAWHERDERYRRARRAMSDAEITAVRAYRVLEARDLDFADREIALAMCARWRPVQER